jgi:hypothetical protein
MHRSAFLFEVNQENISAAAQLHLDSIFIGEKNANHDNLATLREELPGKKIFVEIGIFAGKELFETYPDAKPVEAEGKDIVRDWYHALCPTHEGLWQDRLQRLEELTTLDIDGIWLDFIRYPTKWEEPEPVLLDTCYCQRCLGKFEKYLGEKIEGKGLQEIKLDIDGRYYYEWMEYKTEVINSFVKVAREIIDRSEEEIKLGLFAVPWEEHERGEAIKRIIGQDFSLLFRHLHYLSPMLYHRMCGEDVNWIEGKINYFQKYCDDVLPLVQTEDRVGELPDGEYREAVKTALENGKRSACIFFLDDLLKKPEKLEITQKLFAD